MVVKITSLLMTLANAASFNTSKKCNLLNSFIQSDLDSECDKFAPRRMQIDDDFTDESITESAENFDDYYAEEEAETEVILYDYDNPS